MVKQRIGYDEYQEKLSEERQAAKQQEIERLKKAGKKLLDRKKRIVVLHERDNVNRAIQGFFVAQMVTFLAGSISWFFDVGGLYTNERGEDLSYLEAFKSAYGMGATNQIPGHYYITIIVSCVLFVMFMGIIAPYDKISEQSFIEFKNARKKPEGMLKGKWDAKNRKDYEEIHWAERIVDRLEALKDYGVNVPLLLENMGPNINKIIKSFSKIDRGYFDNLARGGLNKADYETCIAIVEGYLKSHPKEYEEIIKVIDEAVLPESIKKKYGKGKVISFGGAQALSQIKR